MDYLILLFFVGSIVFLGMLVVSLFKKNKKGKRNILISIALFVSFFVGVIATAEPVPESPKEVEEVKSPEQIAKEKEEKLAKEQEKLQKEKELEEQKKLEKEEKDQKKAEEKLEKEQAKAEKKAAEEKKLAEEKAAKEKKLADEKAAKEKAEAEELAAKEKARADLKANAKTIDYPQLEKNPDRYSGEYVKYTGEIVQILEGNEMTNIRLSVTEESYGYSASDIIFVEYLGYTDFVEGDIVTVYGLIYGSHSYESQAGFKISLPGMYADEIQ